VLGYEVAQPLSSEECSKRSLSEVEHLSSMFYCYILKLSNNKFYIGYSENLKQRIVEHKSNQVSTTKGLNPILI
jgi:hypothetical protein